MTGPPKGDVTGSRCKRVGLEESDYRKSSRRSSRTGSPPIGKFLLIAENFPIGQAGCTSGSPTRKGICISPSQSCPPPLLLSFLCGFFSFLSPTGPPPTPFPYFDRPLALITHWRQGNVEQECLRNLNSLGVRCNFFKPCSGSHTVPGSSAPTLECLLPYAQPSGK